MHVIVQNKRTPALIIMLDCHTQDSLSWSNDDNCKHIATDAVQHCVPVCGRRFDHVVESSICSNTISGVCVLVKKYTLIILACRKPKAEGGYYSY